MSEVVSKNNAPHYIWGINCDGWHLAKSSGLSVIQERVPQGGSEVKHYHNFSEQFFFILEGEATMEINDRRVVLVSGEGIHIAPGIPHMLGNVHHHDLIFLVISTPPSHGDRVLI